MINQECEQAVSPVSAEEVTDALNGILTTDKFSASPQMSAFLKYVVEQTLIGNTRRIKAFTVGIEALGKPASFDPQTDPSVRVLAKRLRSSLEAYYQQNQDTVVYIEMKPGSYIPRFLLRAEMKNPVPGIAASAPAPQHSDSPAYSPSSTNAPVQSPATTTSDTIEMHSDRHSGINQLWQAYKSASKVA